MKTSSFNKKADTSHRPIPVTIVAIIYILAGGTGIIYHAREYFVQEIVSPQMIWVLCIRLIAIVCGILLLKGLGWSRWLAITWLAYHVIIGFYHTVSEGVMHLVLLGVVAVLLYLPASSAYFKLRKSLQQKH